MARLTPFQREVLYMAERWGGIDNRREIVRALGTNHPNMVRSLRILRERGMLEWVSDDSREMRLTAAGREALNA